MREEARQVRSVCFEKGVGEPGGEVVPADERVGEQRALRDGSVAANGGQHRQIFVGLDRLDEAAHLGRERREWERMRARSVDPEAPNEYTEPVLALPVPMLNRALEPDPLTFAKLQPANDA